MQRDEFPSDGGRFRRIELRLFIPENVVNFSRFQVRFIRAFPLLAGLQPEQEHTHGKEDFPMRKYELVCIFQPDLDETAFNGALEKVKGWISESGGNIDKVDVWGRRKLAYIIK